MKRRDFLRVSVLGTGALWVGVNAGCGSSPQQQRLQDAAGNNLFQPTHFLTITPDNQIKVGTGKAEMGQGVFELYRLLVAEELAVEPGTIEVTNAIAGPEWQIFGLQITGGSTSTPESWDPIRTGAATARSMMLAAAASKWSCPPGECTLEGGKVLHAKSGKSSTFGELIADAARQPIPEKVTPIQGDFKVLGKPHVRTDIHPKITGAPIFGIDVDVPGMVRAVVIRPPVFGGTLESVDDAEARKMKGVVDIFPFELGVAVVAEKYWQASRAAKKVKTTWNHGRNATLNSDELMAATVERSAEWGAPQREDGDVPAALKAAGDKALDSVYTGPFLAHACLEPMNATVHIEEDKATVWAGTQFQTGVTATVADIAGISRKQVTVHTTFMGGGFGRRSCLDFTTEAALISKRVGKPVQVIFSREDDTKAGYYRPVMVARMKGALGADGQPTAYYAHALSQNLLDLESWGPSILPEWMPRTMITRAMGHLLGTASAPNPAASEGLATTTYDIPNVRVDYTPIRVGVPVSFWRSVGHTLNAFAAEGFMDELAHAAKKDPVEFRRGLLTKDPRKLAVLEAVAKMSNWGSPIEEGWGRGVAAASSFGSFCALVLEAGYFDGEIKVRKGWAAIDCGTPINPEMIETQITSGILFGLSMAMWQKIDIVDGHVQQSNYHDFRSIRLHEAPELTVQIIPSTESPTGVGEPGTPPAAPALAGALFQATGKRLRSMPFIDALKEKG